ncbi:MAG: hypothetical protein K6T94_06325 [Paenibacillus sp.]|nr:hypothetical protein [Paenibacillus sp.]
MAIGESTGLGSYGGYKAIDLVHEALVGHTADGKTDFSAASLRESVQQSLLRLHTDYLDSILIHNPPFDYLDGKYGHFEHSRHL